MKEYKFHANCKTKQRAKNFALEFLKDLRENPNSFEITIKELDPFSFEIIAKEKPLEVDDKLKELEKRERQNYRSKSWRIVSGDGFYNF